MVTSVWKGHGYQTNPIHTQSEAGAWRPLAERLYLSELQCGRT